MAGIVTAATTDRPRPRQRRRRTERRRPDRRYSDPIDRPAPSADRSSFLDRRTYLRLAGTTLAGAATLGAGTGGVSGAISGELDAKDASGTLEVSSGESLEIHVGENEHGTYGDLENVLIDITASGADAIVKTHGGNWTIRNVGVRGESNGALLGRPMIPAKTSGSALIENVYLGDGGDHGGHGSGRAGVHVAKKHSGRLTIRRLNVANWTDNGVYGSSPGKSGGGGVVEIEESYGENNNIANFRIGTPGSHVRDCVSVTEGSQNDLNLSRGVWCRHRDGMVVENTDIDLSGPAAAPAVVASKGGSVTYRDSDYATTDNRDFKGDVSTSNLGTDPSTSPSSGVPSSAEAAAGSASGDPSRGGSDSSDGSNDPSGSDGSDGSSDGSNESSEPGESTSGSTVPVEVLASEGNDGPVEYELRAAGTFSESLSEDSNDRADGSRASGKIWPGFSDTFPLDGALTGASATGEVTITVDGQPIDLEGTDAGDPSAPSEDSDSSDSDSDSDSSNSADGGEHSLVIGGTGSTTNGSHEYRAVVDAGPISDLEGSAEDVVSDDGTEVTGKVWAPFTDRHSFSGDLVSFEADGSVEVRVDGEAVDPDLL